MTSPLLPSLVRVLSRMFGWAYFVSWSVSFYPQPLLNYQRKSTSGLAIDLFCCNVIGFLSYAIFTCAFYFSPLVRAQYAARHPASPTPTVRANDVAFALHALVLCCVCYSQFFPKLWGFHVGRRQRMSLPMMAICGSAVLALLSLTVFVALRPPGHGRDSADWGWIDVIYAFGHIKLLVTVTKYCPQVWVNYKRKSTVGFSIAPILMDAYGGIFSISQLLFDSFLQHDWAGVTGNPAKLWLGNISLFFDAIFFFQYYYLYKDPQPSSPAGDELSRPAPEATSLLSAPSHRRFYAPTRK